MFSANTGKSPIRCSDFERCIGHPSKDQTQWERLISQKGQIITSPQGRIIFEIIILSYMPFPLGQNLLVCLKSHPSKPADCSLR